MGYSDPKFYSRSYNAVAYSGVATGTITASGSNSVAASWRLPKFPRRTAINKVRVHVVTAPASNLTGTTIAFLNGTNTFASVTVGTNTVGAILDGTITLANATFAADAQPTVTVVGTGTASGQNYGAYDVYFEKQEAFQ